MPDHDFASYFTLLRNLQRTLAELTEVAYTKTAAVRSDDLAELDQCIKKEQALSLSLRGYEQKRENMQKALGLTGTSLHDLVRHCPSELQAEAQKTVNELLSHYQLYLSAAEVARSTLECNLHQIEKFLAWSEQDVGAGYQAAASSPEPPSALRADFHA